VQQLIFVKLKGGLGNQMFQYAIAKSLSNVKQTDFKLDISEFDTRHASVTPRKYELDHFNIIEHFATEKEIKKFKQKSLFGFSRYNYYTEKSLDFDPEVFDLQGEIYLDGYWQSEKYFKKIENIIKNEFVIKTKLNEQNKNLLDQIKKCNSVSIHIRRGDYVTDPDVFKVHGICNIEYYNKCIDIISQKLSNPNFFVFSDDQNWAKENIAIKFPTVYISHNGLEKGYEDLRLMSNCKYFIIANSTFSWWGAWLSNNPDKIVLAPKKWFNKEDMNNNDIIPEGWIKI